MKKLIFILALVVSIGTLYAQQTSNANAKQKKVLTPEEKAEKQTNRLKAELSLTEEQVPKVKQATLTRITNTQAAKTKAGGDNKASGPERKKIFESWEAELKGILTPEQYTTYLAKKEEKKKKSSKGTNKSKPADDTDDNY